VIDLYAGKGGIVSRLEPVVAALVRANVPPDALSAVAILVSAVAALALLASAAVPAALLAVPALAAARLVLNLLDGAVARRTGRSHPRGEVLNEAGDRVSDLLFLAPVAALPDASAAVVLLGVIGALLASHVGVSAKAAGGRRIYGGILSKPGRMVLVSIAAAVAFAVGPLAWAWFGPLLLAGATLTLLERLWVVRRDLP